MAQKPLILRLDRLMQGFANSDDERDFYLELREGFILFFDLDKVEKLVAALEKELNKHQQRYILIPKSTLYERKKLMENFATEKIYDIDLREKALELIHSRCAVENFLEFVNDHPLEQEKWEQYTQDRFRIRAIEWLRQLKILFVFEEDLTISLELLAKAKQHRTVKDMPAEVFTGWESLTSKAHSYSKEEAIRPRPKRGRPPKHAVRAPEKRTMTADFYKRVPIACRPFLFLPEQKSEQQQEEIDKSSPNSRKSQALQEKLAQLRQLASPKL